MKKSCKLITATTILLLSAQQYCLATDFDPLSPPATSVMGAGGNNASEVTTAIQQSDLPEESKHVNVLYQNGAIVLRGVVNSDLDRQRIGSIAEKCGCVNIRNEITIKKGSPTNKAKIHKSKTIIIGH